MCANSNPGSSIVPSKAIRISMHNISITPYLFLKMYMHSFRVFSSHSCIIDANPLHWHSTGTVVGWKEVRRQPCSWLRTCSSTQPITMQSNHFNFHKQHALAKIQHMCITSCQNCDQNWYSFCVSRALGKVFLVEKSTNFTLKQNTVGGREKAEKTYLHPEKERQTVNILVLLYLECQK